MCYFEKSTIEIDFFKQASVEWNIGYELWNSDYIKLTCNISLWTGCFEMCNNLFQKSENIIWWMVNCNKCVFVEKINQMWNVGYVK